MPVDLSVTFTGIRFENPFLLASAPPTESESNILNAFEAGWGGVVTKTIGMHPVANVAGPKTKFLRVSSRARRSVDEQGARRRAALVLELGAHLRQAARLVAAAHRADQEGLSEPRADRLDHGRLRQRQGARALAHARDVLSGRRRRRPRAEPVLPAHGSARHGVEHRQGSGALLVRHAGREGRRPRAGLGQAHARHRATSSSKPEPSSAAAATPSARRTRSRRSR